MDRGSLIPEQHAAERAYLLDVLAGRNRPFDVDAAAFLQVAPGKLHPLLHVALRGTQLPPVVRETLDAGYRRNALQELRRGVELRRIDTALRAKGIRFLILKGPVLAATVYPERAARTMTDLDFLIAEEDVPSAQRALGEAGYRVPDIFVGRALPLGDAPTLIHDQPGGPSIELHTMLDSLPNEVAALAQAWPHARKVDLGHGVTMAALEPGEFFAHVAAHVSRHHRFMGELRSLFDVALLLRHNDLAWPELLAEWEHRGIAGWVALTVRLAHILLDAPLPPAFEKMPVLDEALTLAAEQLWIPAKSSVPGHLSLALGGAAAPMHTHGPTITVPIPNGIEGARLRASRTVDRIRRFAAAALRPADVVSEADRHRKRERLFSLLEKSARE